MRILSIMTEERRLKVIEGAARGIQIDEPQVLFLEHEGAVDAFAVGDDESDVVLPHLTELLHGKTDIPHVGSARNT